ncbi:Protein tyrosine phosphatase type IVA 2 [Goodea atripinnis]|uniref:Protein tyrosine phosphatase type IVA 2 n=1 Tax=Goodea atripinnis TaxID=208336 RepID=A0ABV0MWG3_9TELE
MLLQLGLTYGLLQATRVWRLQGWEESSAKLSTCCLLWTSEQKEEQRRTITAAHTHSQDLKMYGVNTLVRVCTATYDKAPVEQEGIQVLDWPFDDGSAPPEQVVDDWLNLLQTKFREEPGSCVAVHCVAGLGRKRRGALNAKQLQYLENYRPKLCLRSKDANGQSCCVQ